MWVVCVIAAILFFVIQVSLRVAVYFQYNTNVEVEKVYKSTIQFPAVTLCNQNNYRSASSESHATVVPKQTWCGMRFL